MDCQNDNIIFEKNADQLWPIASITKLVTALVFLDYNQGWEKIYEIKSSDKREGGRIYLFTGDKVKVKDLFYFSLVGSDNTATTGLTEKEFVQKMNEKMQRLDLTNTKFIDPIGLNNNNVSTAKEIAKFTKIALANKDICQASLSKKYEFTTLAGRKKVIYNTNELLNKYPDKEINLIGGKTGHMEAAGYCLVSKFKNNSHEIITVVLGAASDYDRFSLTQRLVDEVYKNF
jgi:D-alanyl-D-alanine carboxypeptidase